MGKTLLIALLLCCSGLKAQQNTTDLAIRDPFIIAHAPDSSYYMYANANPHIAVYKSRDLQTWENAGNAFSATENFWGKQDFWAPDVYAYRNKFYMFTTFSAPGVKRGTSILEAAHPAGPFTPLVNRAATPQNMMSLDGILYAGADGVPWLVYCHEWLEVKDGRILAQRLTPDLKSVKGKPVELLRAGSAPWAGPIKGQGVEGYVTDAPFFHRTQNGELLMLWSSFTKNGKYAIGVARSASGKLQGPWQHDPEPLNTDDGGHAMLFRDFNGQLRISYHAPNTAPNTRVRIYRIEEQNGKLKIIQ